MADVNLTTYDQILKDQFLELLKNQVNTGSGPLYNMIKSSEKNIDANQVIKSAPIGINGGAGVGSETGVLPTAGGNMYKKFISSTKNYYGTISIGDKVMKATKSNKGAFIDALVSEMEGIKKACTFIYARDLFLEPSGILTTCKVNNGVTTILVDDTRYLIEGLTIDICSNVGVPVANGAARRIKGINRATGAVLLEGAAQVTTIATDVIVTQNSYNQSLTGMKEIFKTTGNLYGVDRAANPWMAPMVDAAFGALTDTKIQAKIAENEDFRGGEIDYIGLSSDVEGKYMTYMETTKRQVNMMEIKGGYTAMSFKGIPMKREKFLPSGTMDMYDTDKFTLHVLSDWDWIADKSGGILQPVPGYAKYAASLAKYAELICDHPGAQVRNSGIV